MFRKKEFFSLIVAMLILVGATFSGGSSKSQGQRPGLNPVSLYPRFYLPFAESSPWKTKIPEDAAYSDPGAGFTSLILGISSWGGAQTTAVARATPDDPLVPIFYHPDLNTKISSGLWKRNHNSLGVEAEILAGVQNEFGVLPSPGHFPCNFYSTQTAGVSWWQTGGCPDSADYEALVQIPPFPKQARVPQSFVSGDGTDALAAIQQPDGSWLDCIHTVVLSHGQGIVCEMFAFVDGASVGDAMQNGRRASMLPSFAGIVRAHEAAANEIHHALVMSGPNALLKACFKNVALAFDANSGGYAGQSCMGERFAIPKSVNVETLCDGAVCVCEFAETCALAHTLQDYGVFLVDRGGLGMTLHTEPVHAMKQLGASKKWLTPNQGVFSRMEILVRNLKIVN